MESSIVVGAFNVPPMYLIATDGYGNMTISGFCVEIMNWLSDFLKIKITFTLLDPLQLQLYGFTQAIINQLIKNDFDIFLGPLLKLTFERMKKIDVTHPVSDGDFCFMLPYPEMGGGHVTSILDMISPQTLVAMIILTMVIVTLISVFRRRKPSDTIFSIVGRGLVYISSVISGRSGNGNYFVMPYNSRSAVRLSVGVWVLMSGVLIAVFTTLLTSYLTVPKLKPIVNSFRELGASNHYKLVEPLDTDVAELFLNAEIEPYKSLGETLRNQRPSLTMANLTEKLYDVLLELNGAYASDAREIHIRIGDDMSRHGGQCRFTASKILEIHKSFPLALRKGDPNIQFLNKGVMRLKESGLINHWISTYMRNIDKCLIKEKTSLRDEARKVTALNVSHLSGAFLFLLMGMALSFLMFLCELIVFRLKSHRAKRSISQVAATNST